MTRKPLPIRRPDGTARTPIRRTGPLGITYKCPYCCAFMFGPYADTKPLNLYTQAARKSVADHIADSHENETP